MSAPGWIGVDLDGTLALYTRWRGNLIGEPVPSVVERVKARLAEGWDVRIFTARVSESAGPEVRGLIERWCERHIGRVLPVTNVKDFHCVEIWDDRAVQVEKNTGRLRPDEWVDAPPPPWRLLVKQIDTCAAECRLSALCSECQDRMHRLAELAGNRGGLS